ncbi:YfhO family protein [bacterium]|nr:YfhO family protein [bacterium]
MVTIRSGVTRQFSFSLLVFVACWALFFGTVLLGDQCFFSHDLKTFYFPYHHFFGTQLEQGALSLWSSLSSCGFPVHAAAEIGVFYPFNWLFSLLFPSLYAFEFLIIFHYLIAGIFMLYLQRVRSVTGLPALFSALTFVFSGFFICHLVHTSIICASAWLPLVFVFLEKWSRLRKWWYCGAAGAVIALQLLASHPQIAVISVFLSCLFIAVNRFEDHDGARLTWARKLVALAIILVLGYGLALVQIIPTFEAAHYSIRNEQVSHSFRFQGSLQPQHLVTLLFPAFFGLVRPDQVPGYGFVTPEYWGQGGAFWEMCGYTGLLSLMLAFIALFSRKKAGSRPYLIVGLISLVLALGKFGLLAYLFHYFPGAERLRFPSRFLLGWTLMVSVLAGNGLQCLLDQANSLKTKRLLKRIVVFIVVVSGLFAVIQIVFTLKGDTVQSSAHQFVREHYIGKSGHHLSPERYFHKVDQALGGILVSTDLLNPQTGKQFGLMIGSVLVLFLLARPSVRFRKLALGILLVIWALDLGWFSYGYNLRQLARSVLDEPATAVLLKKDQDLFRYLSLDRRGAQEEELLKPCFNVIFGLSSLFTPGPLMMDRFQQWLHLTGTGIHPYDMQQKQSLVRDHLELISMFNIKYIVTGTPFPADERFELLTEQPVLVYRNKLCLPRFMIVPDWIVVPKEKRSDIPEYIHSESIDIRRRLVLEGPLPGIKTASPDRATGNVGEFRLLNYEHHHIHAKARVDHDCFVRAAEAWYPGWRASIDGQEVPILRSEGFFRALYLNPGHHEISFVYKPFSLAIGLFLSLCCIALITAAFLIVKSR